MDYKWRWSKLSPDKTVVLLYLLGVVHDLNDLSMTNNIDDKIKVTIDKCLKRHWI